MVATVRDSGVCYVALGVEVCVGVVGCRCEWLCVCWGTGVVVVMCVVVCVG